MIKENKTLSMKRKCELLDIKRSSLYSKNDTQKYGAQNISLSVKKHEDR